jgi:large subunit ribosomal protein L37Ae
VSTTKKVKSAGRYRARYGIGIRRRLLEIEAKQKKPHSCPYCGFMKVKRKAAGIFICTKCGAKFAGGAFVPQTLTGSIVTKMVMQKSFLPAMNQLIEATESGKTAAESLEEARSQTEKEEHKKTGKKGE